MTDATAANAAEPIVLNEDQQEAYDAIMAWLEDRRDAQANVQRRFEQSKFTLPSGAGGWFYDNPDDFFVLRGVAGSGKSTLTSKIIVDLSADGWNMVACAPTNKAVSVIQEKVREAAGSRVLAADFRSLHSACGLRLVETDEGEHVVSDSGQAALDQFDLAVVDECSMIDASTLLSSIQRNRGKCLILFIGDPAQLPPITEKSVAKVFRLPQGANLTKITRQAEGNPLITASAKIREKARSDLLLDSDSDSLFAGMGSEDRIQASDMMDWLPDSMVRGSRNLVGMCIDYQRQGVDARIVSYRNVTVLRNNEAIHYSLYPESGRVLFSVGERVMMQAACKAESLDTGKPVDLVTSEELVVEFVERDTHPSYPDVKAYMLVMKDDLGKSVKVYVPTLMTGFNNRCSDLFGKVNDINRQLRRGYDPKLSDQLKAARGEAWAFKKAFANVRHCYSLTVFKAQGSTFDVCLVDLPDLMTMQSTLDFNSGLYVAVTRPRIRAHIAY